MKRESKVVMIGVIRLAIVIALGIVGPMAALTSCTKKAQRGADDDVVCGGFSEYRLLTGEDSLVFKAAVKDDALLNPVLVSTQVVGGMNYRFRCEKMNPDSTFSVLDVKVFKPLEGEGEPEMVTAMRMVDADETGYLEK